MASKRTKKDADGEGSGDEEPEVAEGGGGDDSAGKKKKAKTEKPKKEKKEKKEKKKPEGHQFNINKALDKAHENKSFSDIIQLPPSAFQGLGGTHDEMFKEFKIETIADMANWKFFKISRALVGLAASEEKGKRGAGSKMNFNQAVDAKYEEKSLKDIIKAPASALQGLAKWADETLKGKSIKYLGTWKYFLWADALVTLAAYENADFTSK